MRRRFTILFPAMLLAAPAVPVAALQDARRCNIPSDFTTDQDTLGNVKSAIAGKNPIDILAVGSATTVGQDLLPQGASFPYRMLHELEAALPGSAVSLTVVGARGLSAAEMLDLIKIELKQRHFTLVLWQTGTVEAVRKLAPDEFHDVLSEGVATIQAQGGDVLFVDPQYSQFLVANSDLAPYEEVFHVLASMPGVIEFRRFELMRSWADTGLLDLEHVPKEERGPVLDRLHGCLGLALSQLVLATSGQPGPATQH